MKARKAEEETKGWVDYNWCENSHSLKKVSMTLDFLERGVDKFQTKEVALGGM